MKTFQLLLVLGIFLLSGCGITHFPTYEAGAPVRPGKVLVIGQMVLEPAVQPGRISKNIIVMNHPERDEANFLMSPRADEPVDKEGIIPFSLSGATSMNLSFNHPSFILMDPGTRYVRRGRYLRSGSIGWRGNAGGETRGEADLTYLYLYGDVKLEIPADAKAVYVGTLHYTHNGYDSLKVTVIDDYKKAMAELSKMDIGITPKDVVKRLAVVVREN